MGGKQADDEARRLPRQLVPFPSRLDGQARAFLRAARSTTGLSDAAVAEIASRLLQRTARRCSCGRLAVAAGFAVLLATASGAALVGRSTPLPPTPVERAEDVTGQLLAGVGAVTTTGASAVPAVDAGAGPAQTDTGTTDGTTPAAPREPIRRRSSVARPAPANGTLLAEAQSLADAMARWRRAGDGAAALTLLEAHDKRFPAGVLGVEAKVARAEILLALGRGSSALAVLDVLTLDDLPRGRELATVRGELRAWAGRCGDARADLAKVRSLGAGDGLGMRAAAALAKCP